MKWLWKILLWLIGIMRILVVGVVIAFKVSVKSGVFIIDRMFDQPVVISDETNYAEAEPKDNSCARPVLFCVHGGGYVSGDKEGIEEFATYIAAHNQITVVVMNYEPALKLRANMLHYK